MLRTLLACAFFTFPGLGQQPYRTAAVQAQVDVTAVAVRGATELSASEAFQSARSAALEHADSVWRQRADRLAEQVRPIWLPQIFCDRAVTQWLARHAPERDLLVVDREDREREHEFGRSYQTTLWVAEDPAEVARGETQLRRELHRARTFAVTLGGGTVGLWAVLAFLVGWVDRLSRGYMTGRLWTCALLVGATAPVVAFLL